MPEDPIFQPDSSDRDNLTPLQRMRRDNILQRAPGKSVEQALCLEDSLWYMLFNNSRDGILILNVDGQVVEANKAFASLTGYSLDEIYQMTAMDMDVGISRESILASLKRITATGVYAETVYQRKDGSLVHVEMGNNAIYLGNEKLIYCVFRDISERKEHESQLEKLLSTDALTGALNRREFTRRLSGELLRSGRYEEHISLILFDVDFFKCINDSFGHEVGDGVLIKLSHTVQEIIRDVDSFARWGGEEFILMMPSTQLSGAAQMADRLRLAIRNISLTESEYVTASFGVVQIGKHEAGAEAIHRADQAMYQAKASGRDQVYVKVC